VQIYKNELKKKVNYPEKAKKLGPTEASKLFSNNESIQTQRSKNRKLNGIIKKF